VARALLPATLLVNHAGTAENLFSLPLTPITQDPTNDSDHNQQNRGAIKAIVQTRVSCEDIVGIGDRRSDSGQNSRSSQENSTVSLHFALTGVQRILF
jgi:hypothetical protein